MSDEQLAEMMEAVLDELAARKDATKPFTPERDKIEAAAFEYADALVRRACNGDIVVQEYWWN